MFTVTEASRGGPILVYNFNFYVEVYFGLLKLRTQNLTISSYSFRSEHRVYQHYSANNDVLRQDIKKEAFQIQIWNDRNCSFKFVERTKILSTYIVVLFFSLKSHYSEIC